MGDGGPRVSEVGRGSVGWQRGEVDPKGKLASGRGPATPAYNRRRLHAQSCCRRVQRWSGFPNATARRPGRTTNNDNDGHQPRVSHQSGEQTGGGTWPALDLTRDTALPSCRIPCCCHSLLQAGVTATRRSTVPNRLDGGIGGALQERHPARRAGDPAHPPPATVGGVV